MKNKKEKQENIILVLIYANWLEYSLNLKNHFQLLEGSLFDSFVSLELESFLEQKSNIITGFEKIDKSISELIKKINEVPVFFLVHASLNKEKEKTEEEIKNIEIIVPKGNQNTIEKKIKEFFKK